MAACSYDFRTMMAADLPLVRHWLATPHVREWWGDADEQFDLVSGDMEGPAMVQFIVAIGGQPFGYLQCYAQSKWPENELGIHPDGTRGIDQFIGEPGMIGRGHGSAFIRKFVDELLMAGVPRVLADPDPVNLRAVRAYEKAGFRGDREVETPDGPALLMIRDKPDQADK